MAVVHWLSAFWLVMDWLWAVLMGLALGLMVSSVPPGRRRISLRLSTVLGTLGVLAGNTAAERFGIGDEPGIDWDRHFLQLTGAVGTVTAWVLCGVLAAQFASPSGGTRGLDSPADPGRDDDPHARPRRTPAAVQPASAVEAQPAQTSEMQ